jgi:hypothetical protein
VAFEWDRAKARSNEAKHGVSFYEAATVFFDPLSVTVDDPDHSGEERRLLTMGHSAKGRLLVVAHLEAGRGPIRLISAREATRSERQGYEEGNQR